VANAASYGLTVNTLVGDNVFLQRVGENQQTGADPDGLAYLQTDAFQDPLGLDLEDRVTAPAGQTRLNIPLADPTTQVSVRTIGDQDYYDAVLLLKDTILHAATGTLRSTVTSTRAMTAWRMLRAMV